MNIKSIFISPNENRLRAGWRLVLQSLLLIFILIPLAVVAVFLGSVTDLAISNVVSFLAITVSVFLARRWFDRRSVTSLGLDVNRQALLDVVVGILINIPLILLIYLIEWAAGWLSFEGYAWQFDPVSTVLQELVSLLFVFLLVGWTEELLSRGYHLQNLESGLNTFWAVLLSSAVFGSLHLGNPNATWTGGVGTFLAGVFMAYGYLRTRQLWLPIGLHIGWNFFLGGIFGYPVSGLDTYHLLHISVDGPVLWTGGLFGPEAGLLVLPSLG